MKFRFVFVFVFALVSSCSVSQNASIDEQKVFNILEKGVIADGKTLQTQAIQKIIDECSQKGGGVVLFPKGIYLSGTIYPKNNVIIELAKGAMLMGSSEMKDYDKHFIFGKNVKNFIIRGQGIIDGQGKAFWTEKYKPKERPVGWLFFENSENIAIQGITLQNSPSHTVVLETCQKVEINQITILNEKQSPNTDGVDITNTSNVKILNCFFSTGDDAICLKSKNKMIENVIVENCVLESDDAGLKFGTGSAIGVQNCIFRNTQIRNTRYGIALFMKDGGVYQNNTFDNLVIQTASRHKTDYPIFIDIDRREANSPLGSIREIYFKNLKIYTRGNNLIAGHSQMPIERLYFENIEMNIKNPVDLSKMKKPKGNKDHDYHPDSADFAYVNAEFTFAHTRDLFLKNIVIRKNTDEEIFKRKDYFFEKVEKLNFNDKIVQPASLVKN
jgi:polygalacturonase